MFRLQLLNNLCEEHPNAYVSIGEKYYYPTRSELFNFEMFRLAKKANMYKCHKDLPIILTLEEDQLSIYEEFEEYLIFGTPLNLANLNQIEVILFLKSICSDEEMRNILRASASPRCSAIYDIFFNRHLDRTDGVWIGSCISRRIRTNSNLCRHTSRNIRF